VRNQVWLVRALFTINRGGVGICFATMNSGKIARALGIRESAADIGCGYTGAMGLSLYAPRSRGPPACAAAASMQIVCLTPKKLTEAGLQLDRCMRKSPSRYLRGPGDSNACRAYPGRIERRCRFRPLIQAWSTRCAGVKALTAMMHHIGTITGDMLHRFAAAMVCNRRANHRPAQTTCSLQCAPQRPGSDTPQVLR